MALEILPQPHRDIRSDGEKKLDSLKQTELKLDIEFAQLKLEIGVKEKEVESLYAKLRSLPRGWSAGSKDAIAEVAAAKGNVTNAERDLMNLKLGLAAKAGEIVELQFEMNKIIGK